MTHEEMKKKYLKEADLHIEYGEKLKEFANCEDPLMMVMMIADLSMLRVTITLFEKAELEDLEK